MINTTMCKRSWTPEEDTVLRATIEKYGAQRWSMIAEHLPGRMGKQCRERWYNHLCPEVKKGEWTAEEDAAIFAGVEAHGSKWCEIIKSIPGRTDNAIKNRYNSIMRRRKAAAAQGAKPPAASSPLGKRQLQEQGVEYTREAVVALATQVALCQDPTEQSRLIDVLAQHLQHRSPPSSPGSDSDSESCKSAADSELYEARTAGAHPRGFLPPLDIPITGFAVDSPLKRQRSSTAAEPEALSPISPVTIQPPTMPQQSPTTDELASLLEDGLDHVNLGTFSDLFETTPKAEPSPFTQLANECMTPATLGSLLLVESF